MEMANATMAIVHVVQEEVFSQALNVLHNPADFSSPVTTLSVDQLNKHPSLNCKELDVLQSRTAKTKPILSRRYSSSWRPFAAFSTTYDCKTSSFVAQ